MALHVFCELVLAACCAGAAWACFARASLSALGFALIGIAALLGAVVYAGVETLAGAHDALSFVAARLGLLLIAAQAPRHPRWMAGVLALGLLSLLLPKLAAQGISLLALVAIAWKGRSRHWLLAIGGALVFAGAGLVVGTQGELFGVPRVDLFHLGLAAAVLLWWRAGIAQG